jgi:formate/nitrite transporter FocA (FNT family)
LRIWNLRGDDCLAHPLIGYFAHCVDNSGDILSAVFAGNIAPGDYFNWLAAATIGNISGGVFMVSLLNYGQVKAGGGEQVDTRLSKAG